MFTVGLRDHPRVCGEKFFNSLKTANPLGSPPRMRGKGQFHTGIMATTGITPAYAGKRTVRLATFSESPDHPRVCGEKCVVSSADDVKRGSPPRMRGKGRPAVCTPTVSRDHPRVCGEKSASTAPKRLWAGSPPRMRGKAFFAIFACSSPGITPAYAGKRMPLPVFSRLRWDHPRVCGEKEALRWRLIWH